MDISRATALMANQHGLAHRAQLRRLGVGDAQVERRLISGSWTEVAPNVVTVAGAPSTERARIWRALLACGVREDGSGRAVAVGGLAAAALHGIVAEVPDVVEIVVGRAAWCPRPTDVRVREVSDWDGRRFGMVDGLRVTALPETLVDIAPYLSDEGYLALLQDQCFGHPGLLGRVLARCHRGSKGSARARRVGAVLAVGLDSPLHVRGVRCLRASALAPTACDVEVVAGAGASDCVYVIDGRTVLALEFDGDLHRLSRKAFLHDRAKDLALREAGCRTLRFTVEQVAAPVRMVADVRRALELPVAPRVEGVA